MDSGELFGIAACAAAVVAGIAFLDWIGRNAVDALDDAHGDYPNVPEGARTATEMEAGEAANGQRSSVIKQSHFSPDIARQERPL